MKRMGVLLLIAAAALVLAGCPYGYGGGHMGWGGHGSMMGSSGSGWQQGPATP